MEKAKITGDLGQTNLAFIKTAMWGIAPIIERVRRPKTSKIILK